MRTKLYLMRARFQESFILTHLILSMYVLGGAICVLCGARDKAFLLFSQVHRSSRWSFLVELVESWIARNLNLHHQKPKQSISLDKFLLQLGSRIMVIKPRVSNVEPGVILIKYSETMPLLPQFFDMDKLLSDYFLVIEPSWSGYCTKDLLHYTQYARKIVVLSKQVDDFQFLQRLKSNLVPIDIGPCDWVDPSIAEPYLDSEKKFDIVMNSNWGGWKRHQVLFKSLREINEPLSVAMIGFDWGGRTRGDIEEMARYYGVLEQLVFFEKVSFEEVMKINCQSRLAILLSLKEGSNRVKPSNILAEGLLISKLLITCNITTPTLLSKIAKTK